MDRFYYFLNLIVLYVLGLCLIDEECDSNEKCFNGQCINPCKMEKTCGLNAICRTENHVVQCSCPQSFTGNQDMECVRSQLFNLFVTEHNWKYSTIILALINSTLFIFSTKTMRWGRRV